MQLPEGGKLATEVGAWLEDITLIGIGRLPRYGRRGDCQAKEGANSYSEDWIARRYGVTLDIRRIWPEPSNPHTSATSA